jgi:fructokinase
VQQPLTIGVGHPGTLTAAGHLKNANSTCLNGQPLQQDLETLLGQPVRLANDANCLALSEATDGAAAGAPVFLAVILGTGTGAAIAVGGHVLTGANGLAGEWGHNPLPWTTADDGPPPACWCGQRGCVETWLSGPALQLDHRRRTGRDLPGTLISQAAAAGDADCSATLERHAHRLARALAAVVNLLDPDAIVLGGGLSRLPLLYERVPALWQRWIFSASAAEPVRTRLLPALHGDASGVRGAAWLWR